MSITQKQEISQERVRRVFNFSEIGGFITQPEKIPEAETYVPASRLQPEDFRPESGNVVLPKIRPMEASSPPGGFGGATFFDKHTGANRTIEEEMEEHSLESLVASSYLLSAPNLDYSIESYVLFYKLISRGVNGSDVKFDVSKIKLMISYMVTSKLDYAFEFSRAASELGSKVLIRAMHDLFVEGLNAIAIDIINEAAIPVGNSAVIQATCSLEGSILFKNELECNQFDYVNNLVGVNNDISTWKKLMKGDKYELPDNASGAILSDKPGVSVGQTYPFASAGKMILAVQALTELFGEGHALVSKDKRNALFDPRHPEATEYNRIVPYGTDGDSMARCALTYGYDKCVQAYADAYLDLKASSADDKRRFSIHDRFLKIVGYDKEILDIREDDFIRQCRYWKFKSSGIADKDAISAAVEKGEFCLSYISTALSAKKDGVEVLLFLLDPGLFLVLVVPKTYGKFIFKSLLVDKLIDNEKLSYSVYLGNFNHQNSKKLSDGLTKLTVYSILELYGVDCSARVAGLTSGTTQLSKVLFRAYRYMKFRSKVSWNYIFIPSYGAKLLLGKSDAEERDDSEIDDEVIDDRDPVKEKFVENADEKPNEPDEPEEAVTDD